MTVFSWDENVEILESFSDLLPAQIQWAMKEILDGRADLANIKRFLLALKAKGESADEVSALVEEMYRHCAPIQISERAVDTVGTGGDGAHTINISTTSAIVAASAGARVVKHGNRAASSKSGSADLLEALGVVITLDGEGVERCVAELGIGFCFAPVFHPAMRFAAPARKELGVPTIFNILGPLANPAQPKAAAVGVANPAMHLLMAEVLATRGVDGFVFRGDDGLDEITLATTTTVLTIGDGRIDSSLIDPQDFGIDRSPIEALVGGDAAENARITSAIFAGERGAPRDAVILNAGAAIAAFEGKTNLDLDTRLREGVAAATAAIDSGAAQELLERWVTLTSEISGD
ncbi:MAG: anthranilate phosphoribosyltransferase [Actinobacteria bacterium]|uniref:anthranilate phosphoribosyltransferase n=1 Tax=freshwater metagenome TaxID=449393 RepID=A0A6J7CUF3_9ZZZZ|nr:anthranilate phosphoribosyltransferase [Actinomycetota bacterium]MSX24469.1 anthranilate phosphoribosyltransferase [Actinomycetota bacterium]MSY45976.1 anthranilate phosphoribosyltransferase [Actinomycetota bacterium]MTB00153.1 anthranilate phosphoribosyltransferase [Actinomycetota bacterium]